MTVSQKRAIGYAIRKRQHEKNMQFLAENGLVKDFEDSKYKSLTWYIKHIKAQKFLSGEKISFIEWGRKWNLLLLIQSVIMVELKF